MFLKLFLFSFFLISLPNWSFANPCEKGFTNKEVFIAFAKKQMGKEAFEKELGSEWVTHITENIKHWTHIEASQFLNFLISRTGEQKTLERIKSLSGLSGVTAFNNLMKKVNLYDKIDKDIIDTLLHHPDLFMVFMRNNNLNERRILQAKEFIADYLGEAGASYVMRHWFTNPESTTYQVRPHIINRIIDFVSSYTQKHGKTTDNLEERRNYFKEFTSLKQEQQKISKIRFGNFSELRVFTKLISEVMRKKDEAIEAKIASNDIERANAYGFKGLHTLSLRYILQIRVTELFSAIFKTNFNNLKKTVAILEQYITPSEVADMMMHRTDIYSVDPIQLQQVINILKKIHGTFSKGLGAEVLDSLEKMAIEMNIPMEQRDILIQYAKNLFRSTTPLGPNTFIAYLIREAPDLLAVNPINLKKVITIFENYMGKGVMAFILQPPEADFNKRIQNGLFNADANHLQKIITALEKHLKKSEMQVIVGYYFYELSYIKAESDAFTKIVEIFNTHIDQNPILLKRIMNLLEIDYYSIPEIYSALEKMNNTLDHKQMKKLLTEVTLTELIPTTQVEFNPTTQEVEYTHPTYH